MALPTSPPRLSTGVEGLDEILAGGLPRVGLYILEGEPGSGKTTFSLQFLMAGVAAGERTLLVAFSETHEELGLFAASHGWSMDGIEVMDLSDLRRIVGDGGQQTLFHSSDIEFVDLVERIRARITELQPTRVVIDSLSELRHLAGEESRYRLNMDALKPSFLEHDCTVLLIDGRMPKGGFALHTLVHGVIVLDFQAPEFGPYRRRLQVQKLRNVKFHEGFHDFEIRTGGIVVFPRVIPSRLQPQRIGEVASSGTRTLDSLLGGGLDRGTSTLIMGPAGSGKSTLAMQFAHAALERGEKAAIYLFDEHLPTLLRRSTGLGLQLEAAVEDGRLDLRQIDPLELSPGKFAHIVRHAVDSGTRLVVIDSLSGYIASMGSELHLELQIRNLLAYMGARGVISLLVSVQHGLLGPAEVDSGPISYLADNVVLLRYFEQAGEVRRAISVFKRRSGAHERTIRELGFDAGGFVIGEPLRQFRGVLTGVPSLLPPEPVP